jgi:hypothetical protein
MAWLTSTFSLAGRSSELALQEIVKTGSSIVRVDLNLLLLKMSRDMEEGMRTLITPQISLPYLPVDDCP